LFFAGPAFATITQSLFKSLSALARFNNLTQSILAKAFRGALTAQWRAENSELISGENSAAALLKKSRPNVQRAQLKGSRGKTYDPYFIAQLTGAILIISCQLNLNFHIQMIL